MTSFIRSILYILVLFCCTTVIADGGGGGSESEYSHLPSDFDKAVKAIENEDFSMAVTELESLQNNRVDDADVLNLLGYAHRKLKHFTLAEDYYMRALSIEPEHKGANEYLGELYLETGRLAEAEERLMVLKKASFFPNKQYRELKKAIKAYKED